MFCVSEDQLQCHSYLPRRTYWGTVLVLTKAHGMAGWIPITQVIAFFIVLKCIFLGTCFSTQGKILLSLRLTTQLSFLLSALIYQLATALPLH